MADNGIGFDTSNYTTSIAFLEKNGHYKNIRKILEVDSGEKGLRQQNAVFAHIKNLPELLSDKYLSKAACVGVSVRPRSIQNSYMPCFLVGKAAATIAARSLGVPCYEFSHQQGHIAAGIYSCGNTYLYEHPFYAFHISGGTMEILSVDGFNKMQICARALDITAGQLIDRTGIMLGLKFPCGKELEKLARQWTEPIQKFHICLKGPNCCLSGFENKVLDFIKRGFTPAYIARFVFEVLFTYICNMIEQVYVTYNQKPVLFIGGVMSNLLLRKRLSNLYDSYFASPELSSDNAVGIAWLSILKNEHLF